MARQIYIVGYTQVVTSQSHPEGLYSNLNGYPKQFDSRNYNDDMQRAFEVAEAEYRAAESAMLLDTNATRSMSAITLERADGVSIYHRVKGAFPVEPEPEIEEPSGSNEPVEGE